MGWAARREVWGREGRGERETRDGGMEGEGERGLVMGGT